MKSYSFVHLADQRVLCEYDAIEARENADTATALALLGEIDARRLYVPAGYHSMYAYCLQARHMSEDRACKRIRVARAAREFPTLYNAVAEGRVHLSALFLLAPHLTPDNVDALLSAATHKTKAQIELLLAERFPKPDLPAFVQPIHASTPDQCLVARAVPDGPETPGGSENPPAPGRVVATDAWNGSMSMEPLAATPFPRAKLAPLSAERFAVQFTMDQGMHDQLRYVQSLLGFTVGHGDLAKVFALALESLQDKLERRKFGKCSRPGRRRGSKNARYIPTEIKRAAWKRDGGQCAFVGTGGKRCDARESLEFDHVDPVARGGQASVGGIRLLCRAHNQHAADCVLGRGFMQGKRQQARDRSLTVREQASVTR